MTSRSRTLASETTEFRAEATATFLSALTHDLNNALSQVLLATGWLLGGEKDAERREFLSDLEASAERAAALAEELLVWSKGARDGAMPFQLEPLLLVVMSEHANAAALPPTVSVQLRAPLWSVHADPQVVATQISGALTRAAVRAASGDAGAVSNGDERVKVRVYNVAERSGSSTGGNRTADGPMACVSIKGSVGPSRDGRRCERIFVSARPHSVLTGFSVIRQ